MSKINDDIIRLYHPHGQLAPRTLLTTVASECGTRGSYCVAAPLGVPLLALDNTLVVPTHSVLPLANSPLLPLPSLVRDMPRLLDPHVPKRR